RLVARARPESAEGSRGPSFGQPSRQAGHGPSVRNRDGSALSYAAPRMGHRWHGGGRRPRRGELLDAGDEDVTGRVAGTSRWGSAGTGSGSETCFKFWRWSKWMHTATRLDA